MAWVYIFGMMEGCTKVNIKMIRSMDLEFIPGLMDVVMKAIGLKASSMASELILYQKTKKLSLDFGKMVNVLSGLMKHRFKL